jgi:hypothetical protein
MGNNRLSNDASESIGAIIYQFYVALDKCFELAPGETILIEKFGDVSTSSEQFEVKKASGNLTDSHINFWNTVNNWMKEDFDHLRFKNLVLLTTQDYGPTTKFAQWNISNGEQRLKILKSILDDAESRYQRAQSKTTDQKAKPESLVLMQQVLDQDREHRLNQIIIKIYIADGSPWPTEQYNGIKNKYLKGIPTANRDKVMSACLGLVIDSTRAETNFEITEALFSQHFQEVTAQYTSMTIIFPKKYLGIQVGEAERDKHLDEKYVRKILEIEYEEAIPEAVTNYVITTRTIAEELMTRISSKKIYEAYNQDILAQIKPKYSIACRNSTIKTLIDQSKNHYDEIMSLPSPALGTFNDTHISFKNGMIHILANDDSYSITWKLTSSK